MARSKKAAKVAASDTITFKKSDLVQKIKEFLEEENACEGDWLNKARVKFLGEKPLTVCVRATIPVDISLEMASDGIPSEEEVRECIQEQMDNGDWCGWDSMDEEDFTITKISKEE